MCLQCAMPARAPIASPPIKLMDVVRVAGEKRRAIVIAAFTSKQDKAPFSYYQVMFRDGHRAEYRAADLTYVAPALG